jgi:acyl-coenzyme A thioesterase PaaI-like protein
MAGHADAADDHDRDDPVAFFNSIAQGPWADRADSGNRLARAIVRVTNRALDVETPRREIEQLVAELEALTATMREGPATRYRAEDRPGVRKVRPNATGKHPLAGPVNPVAPPIALRRDGGLAFGDATYDLRFEGLPGLVQGGFIAAAFDLILGQAVGLSGGSGMTGSLSVRYVSPTPLYQPLRYASWLDRIEGRKTFAKGALTVAETGRVCAEAEAVFITPRNGLPSPE